MLKLFTSFKKHIDKIVLRMDDHKIGTELIILLITCAVIFVVFPIAYTFYSSEILRSQWYALGQAEADLAFQELDLVWPGLPSEDRFSGYSGRLILVNSTGNIVFSTVPDIESRSMQWTNNENSIIFNVVSFAWAGFGATFGPIMLFSLFWKRTNRAGAIAGMLTGGITVFVWKLVLNPLGGVFTIYELLPAFLLSSIAIVAVSLLTAPPAKEIEEEFERAKQYTEDPA